MPANTRARSLENSAEPRKLGLRRVYPPPGDDSIKTEVDIVAIHGLDTHSPTTWEAWKDGDHRLKVHWLQDKEMLPSVIKNARIFTYDWNASYDKHSSSASLLGMADGLLERLRIQRSKDENKRPIVFALHRAYEVPGYRDIFEFTVGAVFLGTPFQGSDQSFYSAAQQRLVVALSAGGEVSNQMVEYLNNSDGKRGELDELVQRFRELHLQEAFKFPMICFYETRETDFTKVIDKLPREYVSCLRGKHKGILVPEHSACFQGLPKLPLEVRHSMLNKYANPEDDAFCVVSFRIKELVDGARKTLQAKGIVSLWESDDWIIQHRYTLDKLKIERLSGREMPIDQCYINLAIVEQPGSGGPQPGEESENSSAQSSQFSLTTRLKVEKPAENNQVDLPKIFDSRKRPDGITIQPRRILIRGQAGVGKTTLCKKMVHDFIYRFTWANLFERILWVPLRTLKKKPDKGYTLEGLFLRDFFFDTPNRDYLAKVLENTLHNSKYSKTLFVLDGLDEISEGLYKTNEMYPFLEFLLKLPNVIITSRPSARLPDHLHLDLELETIRFYPKQIKDYLKTVLKFPQGVEQVESFLRRNSLIHSLVRIPIQLDALCLIWDKKLPQKTTPRWTMTTIYVALEQHLWKKDVYRLGKLTWNAKKATSNEIKNLTGPITTILECLAFDGMYHNVVEFQPEYRDIVLGHIDMPNNGLTLADVLENVSFLRTSDPSIEYDERSYHFLHLTYQEFFAAKYFVRCWQDAEELEYSSNLEHQESRVKTSPKDFLRKFKYSARYDIVWRFAAGLFGRKASEFFELIEDKPLDLLGPTHQRLVMHCLCEADLSACPETRSALETKLSQWVLFEFDFRDFRDRSLLALENEFPDRALRSALEESDDSQRLYILRSLSFPSRHISMEIFEYLAKLLKTTNIDVESIVIQVLEKKPDLPDTIVTYLVELLLLENASDYFGCGVAKALENKPDLPDTTVTRLLGVQELVNDRFGSMVAIALANQSSLSDSVVTTLVRQLVKSNNRIPLVAVALRNKSNLPEEAVLTLVGLIRNNATAKDVAATTQALEKQLNLAKETATTLEALLNNTNNPASFSSLNAMHVLEQQSSLSEKSITILITLLEFADDTTKSYATDILRNQSNFSEQIAAAFVTLLRRQWIDGTRNLELAFHALRDRENLSQQTIHSLLQLLENAHCVAREYAAKILARQSKLSGEAETTLQTLARNSNASIQYTATVALNQQSNLPRQTVMGLLQLLKDVDNDLQQHAARALGEQSSLEQFIPDLIALLKDEDRRIRGRAYGILIDQSKLSEKTTETLIQLLKDSNMDVRDRAAKVLRKQSNLSAKAVEGLMTLLKNESGAVNIEVALILGEKLQLPEGTATAIVGKLRNAGFSDLDDIAPALGEGWDLSRSDVEVITELLEEGLGKKWDLSQWYGKFDELERALKTPRFKRLQNGPLSTVILTLGRQSNLPKRTITALTKTLGVREEATMVLGKQLELPDEVGTAIVRLKDQYPNSSTSIINILGGRSNWPMNIVKSIVPRLVDNICWRDAARVLAKQSKLSKEIAISIAALVKDDWKNVRPRIVKAIGEPLTLIDKTLEGLEVFSGPKESARGRVFLQADKNKRVKISHSDGSRIALQAIGNLYGSLLYRSFREQRWLQVNEDLTLTFHGPDESQTTCFSLESLDEVQNWRRRWNPRGYNLY
ncbi:ARM repeat-containing protein [Xylaria grammica]|nr:ARM repeat-containing protein [Xylaria grammica]